MGVRALGRSFADRRGIHELELMGRRRRWRRGVPDPDPVAAAADGVHRAEWDAVRGPGERLAGVHQRLELLLANVVGEADVGVGDAPAGAGDGAHRLPDLGIQRRRPQGSSALPRPLRRANVPDQYVRWAQEAGFNVTTSSDAFFSFDVIRGYFKDYIKAIVTRRNSYSGVRYYDEPAIFAWELMNEPRCVSKSSAPILQDWIIDMSSHIKSLDKKHLVTIGLEGFYGPGRTERLRVNPGEWAATFGSDFLQNSADEHIDFASVHAYPDSWIPRASLEEKVKYLSSWVDSHVNDSQNVLKKPVLFLEFGSNLRAKKNGTYEKNVLLNVVYDKVYESAKKGQAGAGALIWQLMVEGMQNYRDEFSLIAWENPSTYKLIVQQSCRLLRLFQRLKKISKPCSDFQP
ncbi:mannan endo-1,4-beta-mannosidase 6 isoform X2 [Elaeis guineensis]|uniref:mannan endo-1,4-beta-mannosidase 6 isoform X2 n=1 Tax=Elaeis guineensis var. tenera TaxID=51953 RepID=UPI003C6D5F0C